MSFTFKHKTLLALFLCHSIAGTSLAVSLETHDNPVANGAIHVEALDNDRSDWVGIPSYSNDPEDDGLPEIDWAGLQIAHDSTNVYFHLLLKEQSGGTQFFGFRHNVYLDVDQDRSTGFFGSGGFLSVGADYLMQGPSIFSFAGGTDQEAFSWNFLGSLIYDDGPTTDVEVALPRADIGDPGAFDFLLNGANTGFLFEDFYPDASNGGETGDFFSYTLGDLPATPGDYNGDGVVDAADYTLWRDTEGDIGVGLAADGTGDDMLGVPDNDVDQFDYLFWRKNFGVGSSPAVALGTVNAPEPSGLMLFAFAIAGAGMANRKR